MLSPRKKLSDILQGDNAARLQSVWNEAEAAPDLGPLPAGEYIARILTGELFNAKSGTPGYKLTCEVTEGEYAGRRFWHDVWLTPAATPMAKRDLGKIGITNFEQLDAPLPSGILIKATLALHNNDDKVEFNDVKRIEFVGIEPGDAFAPEDQKVSEEDISFNPEEIERSSALTTAAPSSTPSVNGTPETKGGTHS